MEFTSSPYESSAWAYRDNPGIFKKPGTYELYAVSETWKEANLNDALAAYTAYQSKTLPSVVASYQFEAGAPKAVFDITTAVADIVSGVQENNGFMIKTNHSEGNTGWSGVWSAWYSSECSSPEKRPKLTITYSGGTALTHSTNVLTQPVSISCSGQQLSIESSVSEKVSIEIVSVSGRKLLSLPAKALSTGMNTIALPKELSTGVHLIKIEGKTISCVKRVIKQ